jgi:hypothetical protein
VVAPGDRRGPRGVGRALSGLAVGLVTVEFLLGMWTALYDRVLPRSMADVFQAPYLSNDRALALHVAVGVLLGVVALALPVWGWVRHRPGAVGVGVGGLVGVALAAVSGSEFLTTGDPIYSFLMALGFLVAMGAYLRGVHALTRRPWGPTPGWVPAEVVAPTPPAPPPS